MFVVNAVVVALMLVLAGPALADATGQVTGTVRGTDGAPIAGIAVSFYGKVSGGGGYALTDDAGKYTVSRLNADTYAMEVYSMYGAKVAYLSRWYNDKDAQGAADPVVVAAGATTAGIDTILLRAGTISGQVTDAQGNGLSGIVVSVAAINSHIGLDGGVTSADANGRYAVTGLAAGDYRVQFQQATNASPGPVDARRFVSVYYGQRTPSDPYGVVHVSAAATITGVDMQLHEGGGISGSVTDGQGNPVADVGVLLEGAGDYANTDAAGHYTISSLEPRDYVAYFEPADGTDFLHQNFGGNPIPPSVFGGPPPLSSGHTPVTVTAGTTTGGVDVRLQRGGAITGSVTDQQGHPLVGISVNLAPPGSGPVPPGRGGEVKTDTAGRYRIGRLLPGTYRVSFAGAGFAGQLYGGAQTYDAASPIDVPAAGTVSGIDAQMQLGGAISGSVIDPAGQRVSAFVDAYHPDGTVASLTGSNAGGFTIPDLAAGSYLVYATALGTPFYGFYTDSLGAASLVHVAAGQSTQGIDIHVHQPAPAAPGAAGHAASSHVNPFHGTLAVSRNGTLAVSLRCTGPAACAGTASLTVASTATAATRRARPARTTISHTRFLVPASLAAPVHLRLTPTGRSLLHRNHGRMTAQLTIAGSNDATPQTLVARLRSTR